jgi:hypothetical protein
VSLQAALAVCGLRQTGPNRSKVQPPPSERVGWTFQTVQGPWGGGPYTRGGERRYKVTLVYYTGGGIMVYYIGVYRYIGGKQYFM